MKSLLMCSLLLVSVGLLMTPSYGDFIGRCYETWSRCSTWSRRYTGRVWLTCEGKCRMLGKNGGSCRLTRSKCPLSRYSYQCQCY
uniref:Uncharacterized protein n=1 Tax=Biomphalaria glabrata TaxID=6526 RepID=A0A182YU75_BIOGL